MNIEESGSVGYHALRDIFTNGRESPLPDIYSLESVLATIKKANDDISYFKALKKKRIEAIDEEVAKLENRVEFLKTVAINTLNSHNEKSVKFPGLGSVSKRKKSGGWVIIDEDKLVEFLNNEGESGIVEMKPKIKKNELNKLLNTLDKVNKIPDCVEKGEDKESLTFIFDKEADTDSAIPYDDIPLPKKNVSKSENSTDDYDGLDS